MMRFVRVGVRPLALAIGGACGLAAAPLTLQAQAWSVQGGASAGIEYNDNYFAASDNARAATIATVRPFAAATRSSETTDIAALVTVAENQVWGPSASYVSGRAGVSGAFRDGVSTWSGVASFVRAPELQRVLAPDGLATELTYTNTGAITGGYTRAISDRWAAGFSAAAYENRYGAVEGTVAARANRGASAGGRAEYAWSDRTQLVMSTIFSGERTDIEHTYAVTPTIGFVHQATARLTVSGSAGGYWSRTDASATAVCDIASCSGGVPDTSTRRHDGGYLLGGDVAYAVSATSRLWATLASSLVPSGTGTFTRDEVARANFTHEWSERLSSRVAANFVHGKYTAPGTTATSNDYALETTLAWRFADRWTLDASYRRTHVGTGLTGAPASANVVGISIAYSSGAPTTPEWIGVRTDALVLPGAGAVSSREQPAWMREAPIVPESPPS